MRRANLLAIIMFASLSLWQALAARAQVVVWQPGQTSFPKVETEPAAATVTGEQLPPSLKPLKISPAPEPIPALKYRFWVSPSLRKPGDAMAAVLQAQIAYLAHPERARLDAVYAENSNAKKNWLEMPLVELADSGVPEFLSQHRDILNQVYLATELSTIPPADTSRLPRGMAAISGLVTEVQNNRSFARLIILDARLAIAEKRFDVAIDRIAAGFRLAELTHDGSPPTMLTRLVSIAISGMMLDAVEELSQQPEAPNLYWALASLPSSLWDLRSTLDGEAASMSRVVYPLLEPISAGIDEREANQRLIEVARAFAAAQGDPFEGDPFEGVAYAAGPAAQQLDVTVASRLLAGLVVLAFADASLQELPELGYSQIDDLSDSEATLRAIQLGFQRGRDNLFKWVSTPGGIGEEWLAEMNWVAGGPQFLRPANIMLGQLIPALQASESAAMRVNSQHKQLLLREALRAYAAENAGNLPASIESLQPLPAWPNPVSGEMFLYERLNEQTAVVRREALYPGEKQTDVRVEIR